MGDQEHYEVSNTSKWCPVAPALNRPIRSAAKQWLAMLLIIGTAIFIVERPAWGGKFEVDFSSDGIIGFAQETPLGQVLGTLADQTGFTVYIDEKLINTPVTFNLPVTLPTEKAIQRMVHPHSYAMVFTKLPGRQDLTVHQVKVFAKGDHSASVVKMSKGQNTIAMTSHARGGYTRSNGRISSNVRSGMAAVRQQVKAPVQFRENAMGFTGFDFGNIRRGPDYRRDTLAMARDYREYHLDRKAHDLRAKDAQMEAAKQNSRNRQNTYRAQRQSSIEQTVNHENK